MASNVVVTILDTTTNPISPKVGVSVTYSKDGGSTHTTASLTNAKGVATNELNLGTGKYTLYIDLVADSSYPDLSLIDLDGNNIKGSDIDLTSSDGDFGMVTILSGNPTTGNDGFKVTPTGAIFTHKSSTGTQQHLLVNNPNGQVGGITSTGTTTAYNTTSDPRVKSVFTNPSKSEIWKTKDKIKLTFGKFFFKNDPDNEVWGFDAHKAVDSGLGFGTAGTGERELEIGSLISEEVKDENGEILKEAVYVTPYGVDQSKLVPYLFAMIDDLQDRVLKLEGK